MAGILDGIRVLDFGRYLAGPYCAALLGDFGAEVIRIDKIGGSEDRFVMPVAEDGSGSMYLQVNRNKRSMTLDPTTAAGRDVTRRLVETADVVVANLPARALANLGLDYATLSAIKPDIILTTASVFGSGGPKAERIGFDGIAQAVSGAISMSGRPGDPLKPNVSYVDFGTALACACGTLAALIERQKTGKGQVVEGSLVGTAYTFLSTMLVEQSALQLDRQATANRNPFCGPSDVFKTLDGWIIVQVIGPQLFKRWTRLMGREELLADPRFATDELRGDNGAVLSAIMGEWCSGRTRDEALGLLDAVNIPAGPVNSPREALDDPHVRANGLLQAADYPGVAEETVIVGTPVRLSRTPGVVATGAPILGAHTEVILEELGFSPEDVAELRRNGTV
ncbi:crotonobetainyl-CoA:carnitine CoA-transferase CaiB-like acyl-CoA transferase [Rhodoligotrophos appendicifer]|uniref:CaiB/BaiF CoA transferase family protein n=1 Tax=Rhodoligotrophos appendicifer TaxID=987056 RepID=UPI001186D193|nr:CoA transferase [Rhodoligotrophos appendicifer]